MDVPIQLELETIECRSYDSPYSIHSIWVQEDVLLRRIVPGVNVRMVLIVTSINHGCDPSLDQRLLVLASRLHILINEQI